MSKRLAIGLLTFIVGVTIGANTAEASWLSKQWKKLENMPSSSSSSTNQGIPSKERMLLVSENQYFKTYVDTRTAIKAGVAQNRRIEVDLIKIYTPLGSQWLGVNSRGDFKPDVVTSSIVKAHFGTTSFSYSGDSLYYDVHNNLIYKGWTAVEGKSDLGYINGQAGWGKYIPYSEAEQIKDKLFSMVGWDY